MTQRRANVPPHVDYGTIFQAFASVMECLSPMFPPDLNNKMASGFIGCGVVIGICAMLLGTCSAIIVTIVMVIIMILGMLAAIFAGLCMLYGVIGYGVVVQRQMVSAVRRREV